jgi:hypothetical protein
VSGAGKTTIARSSPYPVLSDELVAVRVAGRTVTACASGFWGELGDRSILAGDYPVAAAFALSRGEEFAADRLTRTEVIRELLQVLTVPLSPQLWSSALAVASSVADRVPVYRLRWNPQRPPWNELIELVG